MSSENGLRGLRRWIDLWSLWECGISALVQLHRVDHVQEPRPASFVGPQSADYRVLTP